MTNKKKKLPMQLIVALSICISILISSVCFLVMAYHGMTNNIISATQVTAKYVANTVNQSVKLTLTPCDIIIRMLYHSTIAQEKTLEGRLKYVPMFAEALKANPIADAVYIGYETGEFYLMRRYKATMGSLTVDAPAGTFFLLQTKTLQSDGSFIWEIWSYTEKLELLQREVTTKLSLDPRVRPWYQAAMAQDKLISTRPYVYFDTKEVGVSLAQKTIDSKAVVAIDATTNDLSKLLATLLYTPGTQLVLVDDTNEIVAYPEMGRLKNKPLGPDGAYELRSLDMPVLTKIFTQSKQDGTMTLFEENGVKWYGFVIELDSFYGNGLHMLTAIPSTELLKDLQKNILQQGMIAFIILLVILIAGWRFGSWLARPLHDLTNQVIALGKFDFGAPIGVPTHIMEVEKLSNVLDNMSQAMNGFRNIARALNREQNMEQMMDSVLTQLLAIIQMQGGAVYLYDEKEKALNLAVAHGSDYKTHLQIETPKNDDVGLKQFCHDNIASSDIYSILRNREGDLLGMLCLKGDENTSEDVYDPKTPLATYIENIAGAVGVGIETRQLIHAQKALLDSLIKLIADAIDTKSLYTGGHCRRVPELSLMLLDEAKRSQKPPFADFSLTSKQNEEFRIAAWLHDCGKITTPEYVVDKATKLETIYNRLHEIRTRFEVLHRDAAIKCLEAILDGENAETARQICEQEQKRLQEEFAFVAKSNIGGEAMNEGDLDRLRTIGARTWIRYFDNRLGLSRTEQLRMQETKEPVELPTQENLLADKPWQIVPWLKNTPPVEANDPNNTLGFDMQLPKVMYNYGELYNLSITRGTLTPEERFKINDHIVQTLSMLSSLPLPHDLAKVPQIASNHHETLIGTGYPRKLKAEQLGIPDRIIAVSDVFEALTASDRPYKSGKTLREALAILLSMVQKQHLDGDIYNLMLESGVYLKYAREYLSPNQIDIKEHDDISEFIYVKPPVVTQ